MDRKRPAPEPTDPPGKAAPPAPEGEEESAIEAFDEEGAGIAEKE
jgi:hypothetical protein